MDELANIFQGFVTGANEAQTERDLIQPVLKTIGHVDFEVQASLEAPGGAKRPDYIFYRSPVERAANRGKVLTEEALRSRAYAVGDAKQWDRPLDIAKTGSRDLFDNRNPSYQIAFYIQHSGLPWGILTNGRLWRLYHRDTAHKLDRFYEVDLAALVESGDPDRFLYFYAFFRREAFEPGPLGAAEVLRESNDYAHGVSTKLKVQVFEAVRHVAQGFLDNPRNKLDPSSTETLQVIHDNALILLYRLLFVLYAEARELLPLRDNATYRSEYSLQAIKGKIASDIDRNRALLPGTVTLWPRLRALFQIINDGNPPLNVATFNGGLFDPVRHPFLEDYEVGDFHLQRAIDILTRVDRQFIDYRDLAEQHLGTIYEGLLEYNIVGIEPEDGWTVDLANEKGERKRTGSYYTPNYVVRYIVEQTLGAVLNEAVGDHSSDADKIRAILAINVLDPAMGSGYFLVEATEYIARFLVDQGLTPDDGTDGHDLAYWKRQVVQSCIYGVDINPLAVDLAKLSLWLSTVAKDRPLSFLDHHLRVGNSVVGTRVSRLQQGDPRAKARKSARNKAARAEAAGQLSMLNEDDFRRSMSTAVDAMWLIERSAGDTVVAVKEQEHIYAELRATLTERYARLADLVTATNFGLDVPDDLWEPLRDLARARGGVTVPLLGRILERAGEMAKEHRFFHWDLEFPEVFFDRHGQPLGDRAGFDAVIGNPPYVRQERLRTYKSYFKNHFPDVYHGVADLYVYFFAQGLALARKRALLAYICSNSWFRANYATGLRSMLRTRYAVERIVDLGDNRVFSSAQDTYPAISVVRKSHPGKKQTAQAAVFTRGEVRADFDALVIEKQFPVAIHDQPNAGWQIIPEKQRLLMKKLQTGNRPLTEVADGRIYYGVKTGLNEAFVIDRPTRDRLVSEDSRSAEIIKPMVRGEDLRPWYQEDEGLWLILIPFGWTQQTFGAGLDESEAWNLFAARYSGLASHLEPNREAARRRYDKGQYWWELRPCDYYEAFEQPKIFWPDVARRPRFSWDPSGMYLNNTGYILPTEDPALLAVLSSRVIWFVIMRTASGLGERAGMDRYRLIAQFMLPLPIPPLSGPGADGLSDLVMKITDQARDRYQLHQRARQRILTDLGSPERRLNQKLAAWWELDFAEFRNEVQAALKRDIRLNERDDWQQWLEERQSAHERHTSEIVRLEREMNARVYALFDLNDEEIDLIERVTKYDYGEV